MAWGGHQNGQIPVSALSAIGNGQYAHTAAALRWFELRNDCRAATGVTLTVTEGYRPLGIESDRRVLVESKTSTRSSNQWFQKGREDRGLTPSAATPGTSVHGWALAIDIGNYSAAWDWLKKNAHRYGYAVDVIVDERWHIEYTGSLILPAALNLNLFGDDMANLEYKLLEFKGTRATRTKPAQPREFMLVSPVHLPDGHRRTTDVLEGEVWENFAGKPERVNTYARFARAASVAVQLAELART